MPVAAEHKFKEFLPPPRPAHLQAQPKAPPPQKGAKPPAKPPAKPAFTDRESDPAVQRARALGQYGFNLLHLIEKDFTKAIGDWRTAFSEVIAAFATAVGERNTTLELAKEEREREAAIEAAVFSLVTAGSMKFLGVFLEHVLVPSFKAAQGAYKGIDALQSAFPLPAPNRFSGAQAAAFGGLVEEAGKVGLDQALKPSGFPRPKDAAYQMDTPHGIENLRADFVKLVNDSAQVVYDQITDAQKWMNESTEFGEAWLAEFNNDVSVARAFIRPTFAQVARRMSFRSELYGTTPQKFDRSRLAKQFERSLWAAYFLRKMAGNVYGRSDDALDERAKRQPLAAPKFAERAIVNRLKELNVVVAETWNGSMDQANRMIKEGEPHPETKVEGAVDNSMEAWAVRGWARGCLGRVRTDNARDFFPPATPRLPAPLAI